MVAHTGVPLSAWSAPSMVSLVSPPLGAAEALDDSEADELALELAELDVSVFLSPDEHPDNPAIRIAAPPTATSNPRFTPVLLLYS
jgi:hypothetical protein